MESEPSPLELIIGVFREQEAASAALKDIHKSAHQNGFKLDEAAILVKDQDGKVKYQEAKDLSSGKGAVFGAIVGGALGLVGGPVGVVLGAAAGAATGGITAGKIDMGFDDDALEELQAGMQPGSSAAMILVRQHWSDILIADLQAHGGQIFRHMLAVEVAQKLLEQQKKDS